MKPQPMPEGVDWQSWPVLEVLQGESGLTRSALRAKLVAVPCYRCTDKSVRYEPAQARKALEDIDDDDRDDDDPARDIDAETLSANSGVFAILAMLIREMMRMNVETRREREQTVKVMLEPMQLGLKLIEKASDKQSGRLEHLEGIWDKMVSATEDMMRHAHERELAKQKQDETLAMRKQALGLLSQHAPMLMRKLNLTGEAGLALEFLESLDSRVVDMVKDVGILDARQLSLLERLQAAIAKGQPPQQQPEAKPPNQAPPNGATSPPTPPS